MNSGEPHSAHFPRSAVPSRSKVFKDVVCCGEECQRILATGKSPKGRQAEPDIRRQVVQWQLVMLVGRAVEDQVVRPQAQRPVRRGGGEGVIVDKVGGVGLRGVF